MDESVHLLSSMSPRIRNKLKPGEREFRRGASVLALKKNIRRSSLFHKSVTTTSNEQVNIVESTSTDSYQSSETKADIDDSVIIIPDSDSSSNDIPSDEESPEPDKNSNKNSPEPEGKTEPNPLLPKEKFDAITNWVANIKTDSDSDSTVFTDLSSICGTGIGSKFIPKEKGSAVNSTFTKGHSKKFDELFIKKKTKNLADESIVVIDETLQGIVIEESFAVINESSKSCSENVNSKVDFRIPDARIERSHCEEISKNTNNGWTPLEITDDDSGPDEMAENILDELYGNSWRVNKELILSRTEPRKKKKKPSVKHIPNTESKPKYSLLYKNPYLDSERNKSQNLLEMHRKKLNDNSKSPWADKLKVLCDSETSSENSTNRNAPLHLNFDESTDDDKIDNGTKSKYFKKKTKSKCNKENIDISDSSKNEKKPVNSSSSSSTKYKSDSNSSSDDKVRTRLKNVDNKKNSSKRDEGQNVDANKFRTKNTYRGSTDSSSDDSTKKKVIKSDKAKINRIPSSTSTSDDIKVTKKKIDAPIPSEISVSSDEEWEEEISKIERRTIMTGGTYSFLASLSANVPLAQSDISARIFKSTYKANKDQLIKKIFKLYNEEVFDNILPGDMLIEWSSRMLSSAGFCYCKKITRRSGKIERSARLVLSSKVLDSAERLRDTLIHEMCHAATFIVNGVSDGHGSFWKSWAYKAMKRFPELPPIKRCHNYVINTKYTYRCTQCGYSIGRHSKSLDIERKRCGYCYGKFEVLINKINKKGEVKAVAATPKKQATGFALFVKENYAIYKGTPRKHGDVMKILGQKFQELKVDKAS